MTPTVALLVASLQAAGLTQSPTSTATTVQKKAATTAAPASRPTPQPAGAAPAPSAANKSEGDKEQDVRRDEALRTIAAELRAIREEAAAREKRQADRESQPTPPVTDWIMIAVTAGAVVAAFMSLGALRSQVDAGLVAARASESAAKTARDQLYLSLRARLGIENTSVQGMTAESQYNGLAIRLGNYGGKGALLRSHSIRFTRQPLPAEPDYDGPQPLYVPLEKGAFFTLLAECPVPVPGSPDWNAIGKGESPLYVYGRIEYLAGFSDKPKAIGFCRVFDPKHQRFNVTGTDRYNYAT